MAQTAETTIEYRGVTKEFGDVTAVDDVSFDVKEGELLALLGPSGSGKTTTLRMLAGFETPTAGEIYLDGRDIIDIPPNKRDAGMVFQDYALFPHMSVGDNIRFGLKRRGYSAADTDDRIEEVLRMVDMSGYEDRSPTNLSGGQQQRVATARAIALEPKVLLMDEPLGALDKKLRDHLQVELTELQNELDITTMYVTHNQEEALTMADRVAVMNEGRIEQLDTPTKIYEEPATEFVADFIGDTNFLEGRLSSADGEVVLEMEEVTVHVGETEVPDGDTVVFVRPEKISVEPADAEPGEINHVTGTVEKAIFLGSKIRYYVTASGQEIIAEVENRGNTRQFTDGDTVRLTWEPIDTKISKA